MCYGKPQVAVKELTGAVYYTLCLFVKSKRGLAKSAGKPITGA